MNEKRLPNAKDGAGVEDPKVGTDVGTVNPLTALADWPKANGLADCVWSLLPENVKGLALSVDL